MSLADKINNHSCYNDGFPNCEVLPVKDVKEAIKKIKAQEIHGEDGFGREIMVVPVEEIDKIFGEELI